MSPKKKSPAPKAAAKRPAGKGPAWISKLRCPACGHGALQAGPKRQGDYGAWGVAGVRCPKCRQAYPVLEGGILQMIPKGDLSRYAYWEKMHSAVDADAVIEAYRRSFGQRQAFVETYYCMPRISRRLGWTYRDSVELGCGWGVYSMSLARAGMVKDVWLLDISRSAMRGTAKVFKAFGIQPFMIQGEIHSLPFKDGAFDLSLSGGLYEHFVGQEQQDLVTENCRVSKRVLCQVPEGSLAYWIYRRLVTLKMGKWPFGFEVPLQRRRLRELYEAGGAKVLAWDYHNLASAVLFSQARKRPWLQAFSWRPAPLYLLRHDAVLAAETGR
ncbi:MAG TPA: methyltransferase domain-containing protein [bacterium]|nr:methyltransferase domain-containing protein [bacterium]